MEVLTEYWYQAGSLVLQFLTLVVLGFTLWEVRKYTRATREANELTKRALDQPRRPQLAPVFRLPKLHQQERRSLSIRNGGPGAAYNVRVELPDAAQKKFAHVLQASIAMIGPAAEEPIDEGRFSDIIGRWNAVDTVGLLCDDELGRLWKFSFVRDGEVGLEGVAVPCFRLVDRTEPTTGRENVHGAG